MSMYQQPIATYPWLRSDDEWGLLSAWRLHDIYGLLGLATMNGLTLYIRPISILTFAYRSIEDKADLDTAVSGEMAVGAIDRGVVLLWHARFPCLIPMRYCDRGNTSVRLSRQRPSAHLYLCASPTSTTPCHHSYLTAGEPSYSDANP